MVIKLIPDPPSNFENGAWTAYKFIFGAHRALAQDWRGHFADLSGLCATTAHAQRP